MFGGFAGRQFPEASRMSNDPAEKRQAFEHWVSTLRPGAGPSTSTFGEESGVTSLDEQKTLIQRLPKDLVRQLRAREAGRHLNVDPDSTAIFHPPPDLIARARRLVPPPKPERVVAPSVPPEPLPQQHPTPLVAAPLPEEAVLLEELSQPALPNLADAVESEHPPPETSSVREPISEPPVALATPSTRASWLGWTAVVLALALVAAGAWYVLTNWDSVVQALS
jgi:hypothetical protein